MVSARDHPRSRGVYFLWFAMRTIFTGSSPLARGLRRYAEDGGENGGIIPARAGFTHITISDGDSRPDHPRSRGVYISRRKIGAAGGGSSPLARGLHPYSSVAP